MLAPTQLNAGQIGVRPVENDIWLKCIRSHFHYKCGERYLVSSIRRSVSAPRLWVVRIPINNRLDLNTPDWYYYTPNFWNIFEFNKKLDDLIKLKALIV